MSFYKAQIKFKDLVIILWSSITVFKNAQVFNKIKFDCLQYEVTPTNEQIRLLSNIYHSLEFPFPGFIRQHIDSAQATARIDPKKISSIGQLVKFLGTREYQPIPETKPGEVQARDSKSEVSPRKYVIAFMLEHLMEIRFKPHDKGRLLSIILHQFAINKVDWHENLTPEKQAYLSKVIDDQIIYLDEANIKTLAYIVSSLAEMDYDYASQPNRNNFHLMSKFISSIGRLDSLDLDIISRLLFGMVKLGIVPKTTWYNHIPALLYGNSILALSDTRVATKLIVNLFYAREILQITGCSEGFLATLNEFKPAMPELSPEQQGLEQEIAREFGLKQQPIYVPTAKLYIRLHLATTAVIVMHNRDGYTRARKGAPFEANAITGWCDQALAKKGWEKVIRIFAHDWRVQKQEMSQKIRQALELADDDSEEEADDDKEAQMTENLRSMLGLDDKAPHSSFRSAPSLFSTSTSSPSPVSILKRNPSSSGPSPASASSSSSASSSRPAPASASSSSSSSSSRPAPAPASSIAAAAPVSTRSTIRTPTVRMIGSNSGAAPRTARPKDGDFQVDLGI